MKGLSEPTMMTRANQLVVEMIKGCVGDPGIGDWLPQAAADLILVHDIPFFEIAFIFGNMERLREEGTLESPSGFFHYRMRLLAERHGIDWLNTNVPARQDDPEIDALATVLVDKLESNRVRLLIRILRRSV